MKIIRFIFSSGVAGLLLAVVSIASIPLLRPLDFWAGYELKPASALRYEMARGGFWLLTLGFNILFVFLEVIQFEKRRLLPILVGSTAILISFSTLFFVGGPASWDQFQKRIKEDIRSGDLETWLRSVEATNPATDLRRTITPEEFAIFGRTNASCPLPRLEIHSGYQPKLTMVCWGSGTPTWAIVLGDWPGGSIRLRWENNLYFYTFSK